MRLYSTAVDRGLDRNRFIGCLSATCRRDARDPLVSPVFLKFFVIKKNCPTCPSKNY
ncbi:MAG: hypothetical protein LBP59_00115 [Planctomycetaceae bacterium]|nr:hypothetical protein [Planctomycetaceae bacterium]